jgi:hypothetical protein
MYNAEDRFIESDILNIITLINKENAVLNAQISTAIAKSHAHKALNEANIFLAKKQATEITLSQNIIDDERELKYYAPVCYANVTNEHNIQDDHVYASNILPEHVSEKISNQLINIDIKTQTQEEKETYQKVDRHNHYSYFSSRNIDCDNNEFLWFDFKYFIHYEIGKC